MFKELIKSFNDPGIPIPFAKDAASKAPSITLLLMFVANGIAISSLIYLHIKSDAIIATIASCTYGIICTILYMIRKLHHASIDVKNQKFDLESEEDDNKTT